MIHEEPDFSRIPWRKLHTAPPERLRADWMGLGWHARGLYGLLLAAANRDGELELGRAGLSSVAALLSGPWSEIEPALLALIESGWIEHRPAEQRLCLPYYQASQDTVSPEAERKRRQRAKGQHPGDSGQSRDSHGTVTGRNNNVAGQSGDDDDPVTATDGDAQDKQRTVTPRIENRDKRENNTPLTPQGALKGIASSESPKPTKAEVLNAMAIPLLAELSEARRRVRPGCEKLQPLPANLQHIIGRLKDGHTPQELRYVVEVWEAMSRRDAEKFQYFNAVTPFRKANIGQYLAMSREDAERPRNGGGTAPPTGRGASGLEIGLRVLEQERKREAGDDA